MSRKFPADFPKTQADWDKLISEAPGEDRPLTPEEEAKWDNAILSHSLEDLREQLAQRRTRGPGKKPAKVAVQLRLPPDVLARWKETGPGWQTRMADLLATVP